MLKALIVGALIFPLSCFAKKYERDYQKEWCDIYAIEIQTIFLQKVSDELDGIKRSIEED